MISLFVLALMMQTAQDRHHADVNRRGEAVMGFDQRTTTHHFRIAADGGEIDVAANDAADTATIEQIRGHLKHIASMFAGGDFTAPMLVHAQEPPGVKTMKKMGNRISYAFEATERGGVVRISSSSSKARDAIHEFLRFQIKDHATGDPRHP